MVKEEIFDVSEESIERATAHFKRCFWDIQIKRELDNKDAEDGATVTREQMLLRAVYTLHLDIEGLRKKLEEIRRMHSL